MEWCKTSLNITKSEWNAHQAHCCFNILSYNCINTRIVVQKNVCPKKYGLSNNNMSLGVWCQNGTLPLYFHDLLNVLNTLTLDSVTLCKQMRTWALRFSGVNAAGRFSESELVLRLRTESAPPATAKAQTVRKAQSPPKLPWGKKISFKWGEESYKPPALRQLLHVGENSDSL